MANIQERRDKSGKLISYSIRVHRGRGADGKQLKPYTATFDVSPTWTEKSARKKAEAFAATFEKECREGTTSDSRQKFADYCEYVIAMKEQRGVKHSTIVRYKKLTVRLYPAIGHIKLKELRPDHLNSLYTALSKPGVGKGAAQATAKLDIPALLKGNNLSRSAISEKSGIPLRTVYDAVKGKPVNKAAALAVADAIGLPLEKLFNVRENTRSLSAKTILEYHRLIHTVLDQAMKEGLIPSNPADRVILPKAEKKEVNYFQPETVTAIREALETEPIKWQMLTHMLLITGARRGEILGLKWPTSISRAFAFMCATTSYIRRNAEYTRTHRKQSGQSAIFPYLPRLCGCLNGIRHGSSPSGCVLVNTIRIRALCLHRITESLCTRTA